MLRSTSFCHETCCVLGSCDGYDEAYGSRGTPEDDCWDEESRLTCRILLLLLLCLCLCLSLRSYSTSRHQPRQLQRPHPRKRHLNTPLCLYPTTLPIPLCMRTYVLDPEMDALAILSCVINVPLCRPVHVCNWNTVQFEKPLSVARVGCKKFLKVCVISGVDFPKLLYVQGHGHFSCCVITFGFFGRGQTR